MNLLVVLTLRTSASGGRGSREGGVLKVFDHIVNDRTVLLRDRNGIISVKASNQVWTPTARPKSTRPSSLHSSQF